jgi:glyoxylase-like metal-dependent hydrolase (beta-lactamase superfamily II)
MTINNLNLGPLTLHGLRDGYFALDGGSMFGVVPKPIWEKVFPADELNRIHFGLNSLLIQTESQKILVDTGIGTVIPEKFLQHYAVKQNPGLVKSLKNLGVEPEEIDFVINTHLHFDHCGGNTRKDDKDRLVPVFPQANYVIQKGEWEYGLNPMYRDKVSYFSQTFAPLQDSGCLQLVDGDGSVTEGISVILTPGHTTHHQSVVVESNGKKLAFLGDAVPTSAHVGLAYIASYDLFPMTTLETKTKLLDRAVEEDWIVAFVHDPQHFFGKVQKSKDKFVFEPLNS